jgi:hypothetical protein
MFPAGTAFSSRNDSWHDFALNERGLNEQDFSRDRIWQKATRTQLSRFSTIFLHHFFFLDKPKGDAIRRLQRASGSPR